MNRVQVGGVTEVVQAKKEVLARDMGEVGMVPQALQVSKVQRAMEEVLAKVETVSQTVQGTKVETAKEEAQVEFMERETLVDTVL